MATITSTELGAVGRYINLGSPSAHDNLGAQTIMAYIRPGTIANGSLQYLFCKHPSGQAIRFAIGKTAGGEGYFTGGSSSSGTSLAPNRSSKNSNQYVSSGSWSNLCITWDGSLSYTGIKLYDGGTETQYEANNNGTGTVVTDAGEDICLLNRTSDYARSFVGDCAYIARWNRVLSDSEIATAYSSGPLAVPDGLVLLWANEQDYSSLGLTPSARSAHVDGALPPNTALGGADETAPVLSGATGAKTGTTSATGAVTTDEANGTLYAVATTSSTKPSAAQVKAGQDHNGSAAAWSDDVAVSSTGEKTFSVTGLSASTTYYLHFMHEDAAANQSTVASSSSFTTDTPDTTAPTLSSPSATATGTTTASASVSTNEDNGTLYYLASENATETASTVKAASSQSVTATGSQSVSITGLTAATSYYVHFVHRDAAGNDSAVATSAQITTDAAPVAIEFVFTEDALNANPTGSSITDATGSTPTVIIKPRIQRIVDEDGDRSRWRQIYAKFTGTAGKRPLFKAVKADYFYGSITNQWKPWYSYDNETWYRFPSPTVGATYLEFQLAAAFTGDTVYVSFQPGYPYQRTKDFVAEIAASYPTLVHQLPSAGTNHVIDTLSNQTDELGQTVAGQPFYGLGVWSPDFDSRTPQRSVVLTAAVHPGEHVADWAFEGFVRYLLSDDSKAVQLRSKYKFLIYPNINPMGRFGGSHVRGQWDAASLYKNANRDFGTDVNAFQLESSQVLRDALTLDAADCDVACSLDFHGQQDDPTGKPIAYWFVNAATADATLRAAFKSRMQAYNAAYFDVESTYNTFMGYMQREWDSEHSYTPECYEQHSASGGTADYMLFGEHLAKTLADSLADMVLDGAYPIIDAAITLDFPDTAPCSLLGYQVWSKLTVTDEEITALWG